MHNFYTRLSAEEKANTITHLLPFIAALAAVYPLLRLSYQAQIAEPRLQVVGMVLFLIGVVLMYGSSTLYHAVSSPAHKRRLRVFDHISIYAMIAGSYSPICLTAIGGWVGWSVFGFLWACVLAGVVGKIIALGKYPRLSLALYLAMGWTALVILRPMWQSMPHAAFWWILTEGVCYTIGAYFFRQDEQHAFYHAIWHVFIVLGSVSHTIALVIMMK